MRVFATTILVFAVTSSSYGQVALGSGQVKIEFNDKTVLKFYEKTTDPAPTDVIDFFHDPTINSVSIKDIDKLTWLAPEVFWLDYYQFHLRCKQATEDWFEVIVNNRTGRSLWLKRTEETKYVSWEEYLRGMFSIVRREDYNQKIRTTPSDTSAEVVYKGERDCFRVKTMKDEWIEIETPDYCRQSDGASPIKSGWIRWRRNDKLLIYWHATS